MTEGNPGNLINMIIKTVIYFLIIIIAGPLHYNIKCMEETVASIWHYINTFELN